MDTTTKIFKVLKLVYKGLQLFIKTKDTDVSGDNKVTKKDKKKDE